MSLLTALNPLIHSDLPTYQILIHPDLPSFCLLSNASRSGQLSEGNESPETAASSFCRSIPCLQQKFQFSAALNIFYPQYMQPHPVSFLACLSEAHRPTWLEDKVSSCKLHTGTQVFYSGTDQYPSLVLKRRGSFCGRDCLSVLSLSSITPDREFHLVAGACSPAMCQQVCLCGADLSGRCSTRCQLQPNRIQL